MKKNEQAHISLIKGGTRSHIVIFLSVLLTMACSQVKQTSPISTGQSAYRHYSQALNYLTSDQLPPALDKIERAININPDISTFYQLKGQILSRMNKPEEALQAYAKVLEFRSYNPVVLEQMAYLHAGQGRFLQAAHLMKKVLAQAPEKNILWLKVAEYYLQLDKLGFADNAVQSYRIRLNKENKPPDPEYFRMKGRIAYRRGEYKKAAENLEKCLRSMQLPADDLIILVKSLFLSGQNNRAYDTLTAFGLSVLKECEVYFLRGWYYFTLRNYKDARRQLELALQGNCDDVLIYFYLGKSYLRLNLPEKARQMFDIYRQRSDKPELIKQLDEELHLE